MQFELAIIIILLINFAATMLFVLKTKSQSSKMLVTLLFSTIGVALLLMMYSLYDQVLFLDIALVFVLLSCVTAIVFAKRLRVLNANGESHD